MLPSSRNVPKQTSFYSDGNILEETQQLIEEAELKLRAMEAGINHDTKPNIMSFDESKNMKNHWLKEALDQEMKELERELAVQQNKRSSTLDLNDALADGSKAPLFVEAEGNKRAQRSRVRRTGRKAPSNCAPEDVVDVVRTARDSVHGALVAARKLSATLDNRTPRDRLSQLSARTPSLRTPTDNQPTDTESARFCSEHGTKRKVCSCLRPDHEGSKGQLVEDASLLDANLVSSNSNVGIFQARSSAGVIEDTRQPRKRLQMSVMPAVSIKRSLEKQVMPVIQVPFPGSNSDPDKRDNTGVRNYKHEENGQNHPSHVQQDPSSPSVDIAHAHTNQASRGELGQLSSVEVRRCRDQAQLQQILEFLLEKVISSQRNSSPSRPRSAPESISPEKSDEALSGKSYSSTQSAHKNSISEGTGGVAHSSLSRFFETYSKAAADSKRAKRKAVERKKEEERSMKAQEQRFKTATAENQRNGANHALIGPFRRAILNGNLRKSSINEAATDSISNTPKMVDITVASKEDPVQGAGNNINSHKEDLEELNESRPAEANPPVDNLPSVASSPLVEGKNAVAESLDQQESQSESSLHSKSLAEPVATLPAEYSLRAAESSNDEYEDDWEVENEGEKMKEESVETRDVGDGSERESHDNDLAHILRTIVEVEENSSQSISLVHHEPASQPSQSAANKPKTLTPVQTEPAATEVSHPANAEPAKEVFSSSRAFLEMTEALKKMLETVVSGLVQNQPQEVLPARRRTRRYDPVSSGSPNDDRMSSGSESCVRRNTNRSPGRRVRFKSSVRNSSATQTEEESKQDAETQVTPEKGGSDVGEQAPNLFLRPSTLSLTPFRLSRPTARSLDAELRRLPFRASRPTPRSLDSDPTSRLLAFGNSSFHVQGLPLIGGVGVGLSPEPDGQGSTSPCGSLSSSCSSALPTDGCEYPANNTIISLSEGEVLAYHSCSCSEGEVCLCAGKGRSYRYKRSDPVAGQSVLAGSAPFTPNPWSSLDYPAADNLMDLSEHFSEGEVIEKLISISQLLKNKSRDDTI